jgi:ribonuclease VapC
VTVVLDASAVLAFVQGEEKADAVEAARDAGALCGTTDWFEVAHKVLGAGRDWELVRALLVSYDLSIEPVTTEDAEWAARRWNNVLGLPMTNLRPCP